MPQLERPSNSRGTNSYLFTLCKSCHLSCGNPDVLLAATTALDIITPWPLTWRYCCFYFCLEGGEKNVLDSIFSHHLPIRLDLGQDLDSLCGLLLNPVPLPGATGNPKQLNPVTPANPGLGNRFQRDPRRMQRHTAPSVASQEAPGVPVHSVLVSRGHVDLSKAHTASSCSH